MAFLLAEESGTFVRAADRLCVSQPSFTALIQELENELGLKLFDRSTRNLNLTSAGREFLVRIQRPVLDLEEAYNHMRDLAAVKRGAIVLGSLPSTAITLIPATLRELQRTHPALQIRVVEAHNENLLSMLRTNEVELCIGTLLNPVTDLAFRPLANDHFVAVYAHSYQVEMPERMSWRDLAPHDLILTSQGSTPRTQYDRAVQDAPARTASRYDVTHMTTAVEMVRQGLGIAVLPRLALPALRIEDLLTRPLIDASAQRTIGVLYREDREPSPAAEIFMGALKIVSAEFAARHGLPPLPEQRPAKRAGEATRKGVRTG